MPPAGFEPTIPGIERPQTHALDRPASGIDLSCFYSVNEATGFSKALQHPIKALDVTVVQRTFYLT
jgi:hypothetical protein